jgi:hypothetical protein
LPCEFRFLDPPQLFHTPGTANKVSQRVQIWKSRRVLLAKLPGHWYSFSYAIAYFTGVLAHKKRFW